MEGGELVLALTDRCTASCSSCPLLCGPDCSHVMDRRLAEDLVDQASSLGFRRVTLAGGEPFLFLDLVRELLKHAADRGIGERGVATNGFWGEWADERIEDAVKSLEGLLTCVVFGFDSFHAEHIGADAFWRAVRSFDRMPIGVMVRVADVYGDNGAGAFFASLSEEALDRDYLIYPLRPEGRAVSLSQDCFVEGLDALEAGGELPKTICVSWDGSVYPCDRAGIPRTSMRLGDAAHTPLSKILTQGVALPGDSAERGA